jgi:hypothetical protein
MTKMFHRTALMFGLLITGPAFAAETQTLTHDGITYVYSVTDKGTARIIEGVDQTNNRPFRLRVAHGRVEGVVGRDAVSFGLNEVKPVTSAAAPTKVAAR